MFLVICENKRQYFSDDCQFRLTQNICTIYSQKSSLHSTRTDEKSNFILFGAPFEKIELPRFGMSRRMKYLVARPTCTPIAHPRLASHLLAFLRSVKFHFQPSPLYRVATSGGYFFCDFTFSPRRSLLVARKKKRKKESMYGAVSLVADNIFARRQCLGY